MLIKAKLPFKWTLVLFLSVMHSPDLQLVSSKEGKPATKPFRLFLLMGGFGFVLHQSSLVFDSWSKKVGVVLTQLQKLANVTQFLPQIKYVFTEQYLQGSQTFSTQVLTQRFASVFILLYFTFNEQSTKIQSKCFEKIFVDLLDKCKKIVQIA